MKPDYTQFLSKIIKTPSYDSKVNVRCAEPVIINNPKLKYYIHSIQYLHSLNYHEPLYKPNFVTLSKRITRLRKSCTYDNITDFYVVTFDGVIIPLYILVPCNKCFLCKDKLQQMWNFRGIAESNYSNNQTYFVTLTYNNQFLPKRGVSITAIQLFMKRLRNNLDKLGIQHNIKYYACGEYGRNYKRPHYHLILWHFPDNCFRNQTEILHFIEKSWSVYDFVNEKHISIGFAQCKPCDTGSLQYVMKYTRKDCVIPPGSNKNFTCCSKFIGIQWFLDNYTFLNQNPHLLSLSINDNIRNEVYTSPYPNYYKYKLMPNQSSFFPKIILDSFEICLHLHTDITAMASVIPEYKYTIPEILNNYANIIYDKHYNFTLYDIDDYKYSRYSSSCPYSLNQIITKKIITLNSYVVLLTDYYNQHINKFNEVQKLKDTRQKYIDSLPDKHYTLDFLRIENDKLLNSNIKQLVREHF